jgi:large subunit ribosomal protein L15
MERIMGTTLSTLSPPRGAKRKPKRVGRGPGSGQGTTAGRGQKGQRSRSGVKIGAYFEGGQMPLQRRLPKRGFKNPFRVEYAPVNLGSLAEAFPEAGAVVGPDELKQAGLVPRSAALVKVLAHGELPHALTLKAHGFSRRAREKVEAAGGSVEVLPRKQQGKSKTGSAGGVAE